MKTILAPVDFSGASDAVIAEAATLARALDARVVLLNIVQPPVLTAEYAPLLQDIAEITAAGEKNAARQLEKLEEKLKGEFVTVEGVHAVGAPIAHIIEQADKVDADYIVMGSHGHTALYDLLVGSTTHGVLMRAKCPVIIVPAVKDGKVRKRKSDSRKTVA
ncbi:universal stress protein [Horticoccus sp. 23ND18S-11]|uniref:universal stress protein n=1 Tax=Horticoccus sp. 23ND18S-11 TaxID=3391832 RepID=UPI0039C9F4E1